MDTVLNTEVVDQRFDIEIKHVVKSQTFSVRSNRTIAPNRLSLLH
jgi:hypothetical protein